MFAPAYSLQLAGLQCAAARGVDVMRVLDGKELAILELLATQPVSFMPPAHLKVAERLSRKGMLTRCDDAWYPTAIGLARVGRTLH